MGGRQGEGTTGQEGLRGCAPRCLGVRGGAGPEGLLLYTLTPGGLCYNRNSGSEPLPCWVVGRGCVFGLKLAVAVFYKPSTVWVSKGT